MKRLLPFFLFAGALRAEPPDTISVPALIEQLAAPKVRLRDEAQVILTEMPEAEAQLQAALRTTPSEEARLRLKRILKDLRDQAWKLRWEIPIRSTQEDAILREVAVSPDGTMIAAASLYGVDLFDTATGQFLRRVGSPCEYANEPGGVRRSVAFSPDGSLVASTDNSFRIFIDRTDGTRVATLPAESSTRIVNVLAPAEPGSTVRTVVRQERTMPVEPWGLAFPADGKHVAVFTQAGLGIHSFDGAERRLLPLADIFPTEGYQTAPRALGISPDRKTIGLALETMGGKDRAALIRLEDLTVTGQWILAAVPCGISVDAAGTGALVGLRDGGVYRCVSGESAALPLHRISGWISGLDYSADETSAFVTASVPESPLRQIALPSGDVLWASPPGTQGFEDVHFAGPDRIVVSGKDNFLRCWVRRTPTAPH